METIMLHNWIVALMDGCKDGSYRPYHLKKYVSINLPKLSDIVLNDDDFEVRNIADYSFPPTVFGQVEDTINNLHRLWTSKRSRPE
jgi:hypothetical protein